MAPAPIACKDARIMATSSLDDVLLQTRKTLTIAHVEPASTTQWDATFAACSYATYFHSREWAEIYGKHLDDGSHRSPLLVTFSDHKTALLPLSFRRRARGLMDTYTTTMSGMPGGFISSDELGVEHIALLVEHLLTRLGGSLSWRVNPYEPWREELLRWVDAACMRLDWGASRVAKFARAAGHPRRPIMLPDVTHTMSLAKGYQALFPNQSAIVRKAKKARKEQVIVSVADDDVAQWREYYDVYKSSVSRWGDSAITNYPWQLFESIFELKSPRIKLWLARQHGKIVCGAICFYARKHVAYWQGAALQEYFHLRPVNLMMLEIIKHACDHGYDWYDFNPSASAGVAKFKESFGAEPLACPLVYVDSPVKRAARAVLLGARGVV
jgi:hypothetical protein